MGPPAPVPGTPTLQIVTFYLVIAAIADTAYTNAITNKEYGVAMALAVRLGALFNIGALLFAVTR